MDDMGLKDHTPISDWFFGLAPKQVSPCVNRVYPAWLTHWHLHPALLGGGTRRDQGLGTNKDAPK